ncbi:MAG: hypothetical protein K2Y21_11460 [Phycisphaerales bacterium]|nr:hypothetical protein [Phycisphaerales bacterium]
MPTPDRPAASPPTNTPGTINTLRILCFALCSSLALFSSLAVIMTVEAKSPAFQGGVLSTQAQSLGQTLLLVVAAVAVSSLAAWPVIRKAHAAQGRKMWRAAEPVEVKERKLFNGYATISIVRAAMIEGVGLLGAVTLFVSGNWLSLAAPALAVGMIVLTMPSQARYEAFLEEVTS